MQWPAAPARHAPAPGARGASARADKGTQGACSSGDGAAADTQRHRDRPTARRRMPTRTVSLASGDSPAPANLTGKRICQLGAGCRDAGGSDLGGQYILVLGAIDNFAASSAGMTEEEEAASQLVMQNTVPTEAMVTTLFHGLDASLKEKIRAHYVQAAASEARHSVLQHEHTALEHAHAALRAQHNAKYYEQLSEDTYKSRYRTMVAEWEELSGKHDELQDDHDDVCDMFRELELKHQTLEDTHGALETRHAALETRHAELGAAAPRRSKRLRT